ncbi:MAG: hypothetical protein HN757_06505 [Calditrichaeota bacterium]|nr:hypothetical protein [Calditrichota bacterium]
MKSRIALICTSVLILMFSVSCTEKSTELSQGSSEQEIADEAVNAIILIFNGSLMYRQDYSEDPLEVSELDTLDYFVIDEQTSKHWNFSLIGRDPITGIAALSKTEMPYGGGKLISFNPETGKYSGWFSDHPKSEREFAGEAQRAFPAISRALKMYSQDYGENPAGGVEDLFRLEYLRVVEWVLNDWKFSLEGSETITTINAVSTQVMDYGEGKLITFNLQTGRYSGWFSANAKTEKDFSDEAILIIQYLRGVYQNYLENNIEIPMGGMDEILERYDRSNHEWILNEWEFSFFGERSINGISAVSTPVMEHGAGKTIHYNLTSGELWGWIFTDEPIEILVSVYVQYVQGARASDRPTTLP